MKVTHIILEVAALKRIPPFTPEERETLHQQRIELISGLNNQEARERGLEVLEIVKDFANLSCYVTRFDLLREDTRNLGEWLESFESILSVSVTFLCEDGTVHCFVDGKDPGNPPHPDLSLPDWGKAVPMTDEVRQNLIRSVILGARREASQESFSMASNEAEKYSDQPEIYLRLSLQRALLGAISEDMIAVTAGITDHVIRLSVYFDGEVTEEKSEIVSVIATEIIADFPAPYTIQEHTYSILEHAPEMLDFWAFLRRR